MTQAERMKAIKDAVSLLPQLSETADAMPNSEAYEITKVIAALEALTPVISGEMVIVPAELTEKMIEAWSTAYPEADQEFNDTNCATADWKAMIKTPQEQMKWTKIPHKD